MSSKQLGLIRLSGNRFVPRTGLPLEDAIETFDPRAVLSRLSPIYGKVIAELMLNQSFYTGRPIKLDDGKGKVSRKFGNLPESMKKVMGITRGPKGAIYTKNPTIAHIINSLGAGRAFSAAGTVVQEGRSPIAKTLELLTGLSIKDTKYYKPRKKKKKR